MTTGNAAAERLLASLLAMKRVSQRLNWRGQPTGPEEVTWQLNRDAIAPMLEAALTAERKATVERMEKALRAQRAKSQCPWEFDAILVILDAEAAR